MNKRNPLKRIATIAAAITLSVFSQTMAGEYPTDSVAVPKNFENYNEFQIEKWGPVTFQGAGKCDILDLYQRNVAEGLGYSTVVDYHSKETKFRGQYSCVSWGLGISFKVAHDTSKVSENYGLSGNPRSLFSARSEDAIKKFFNSDSAFLEVESVMPVTYQAEGKCYAVDFLVNRANEESGFHGIIDMKYDEVEVNGESICTFWGLGVKYKRRDVVEKVITRKRVIEVIKVPPPKPDTVFVEKPAEKPASKCNCCCVTCACGN